MVIFHSYVGLPEGTGIGGNLEPYPKNDQKMSKANDQKITKKWPNNKILAFPDPRLHKSLISDMRQIWQSISSDIQAPTTKQND